MSSSRVTAFQRPTIWRYLVVGFVLLVLIASTGIIYLTGGTEGRFHALAHLYYVPIVVAAFSFGPVAGVLTGLVAALLGGPLMPANTATGAMQPIGDWLTRACFFVVIGGIVGALVRRSQKALEAERRRREQLDVLHDIDKAILSDQSLDIVFQQIVEAAGSLFGAEICCLYLRNNENSQLMVRSCWTHREGRFDDVESGSLNAYAVEVARKAQIVARAASSRRELVTYPDLLADPSVPESTQRDFERLGLGSAMASPLANQRERVGALLVGYAQPHEFTREQRRDLLRVSHQATIALKNIRQLEQLSHFGYEMMAAFSEVIAQQDAYTGSHVDRIKGYAAAIAQELELPPAEIDTIRHAAQLHDIGKLAIPTDILRKPGPLSRPEWRTVEQHPVIGSQILERVSFLRDAAPLVRHHHERYDGSGYPAGLSGDEIPLGARIIAVADAFDAMISDRPYRRALSFRKAIAELRTHAGTQFDPQVVAAFLEVLDQAGSIDSINGNGNHRGSAERWRSWLSDNSSISDMVNDNT